MFFYAGVVINSISVHIDKIFTYEIPENLVGNIDIGHRIKVPFGKGNKLVEGFVLELKDSFSKIENTKSIFSKCDEEPILSYEDVELVKIMRDKYLCTYIECIRLILPSGISKGMKKKTTSLIYSGKELEEKYRKDNYINIYQVVKNNEGKFNKTQLSKNFNLSISSINTLLKHGFLEEVQSIEDRFDKRDFDIYHEKKLMDFQENAINIILNSEENKFLLHGVTGSGKTEIYMNLVSHYLREGKESIILVPEISLTPQMVERFKGRFGRDVAVFHSKLSEGERFDEWMRVKEGKVKVAVGARSALFLPFKNLGLIVIDEEHENSYKSDNNPKYNARDVAFLKSDLIGCTVVLGSATPSIESYYEALKGELKLITLSNRVDNRPMPEIEVVDMREELMQGNKSIFSRELYKSIEEALEKKEQIILFLNKRGFSSFISCRKCGFVYKCDNCDISLTYHNHSNKLVCHYCGATKKISNTCPSCGSKYIKQFGVGTERVEEEVRRIFKGARTLRMDFDTTRTKNAYEEIYNKFKNKEADILIGTQMIAKGLDFENVTLVGILAADLSLNIPDFRSSEKTFELITQVSGRAGRGEKKGKVILQSYSPDEYSIQATLKNDYIGFYNEEIKLRKALDYPPFSKLLLINATCAEENTLIKAIHDLGNHIELLLETYMDVTKLGPCPSGVSKIKGEYRWQIILKGDITEELSIKVKELCHNILKKEYKNIKLSLDINPTNLM